MAYGWHTDGIRMAYGWHTDGVRMVYGFPFQPFFSNSPQSKRHVAYSPIVDGYCTILSHLASSLFAHHPILRKWGQSLRSSLNCRMENQCFDHCNTIRIPSSAYKTRFMPRQLMPHCFLHQYSDCKAVSRVRMRMWLRSVANVGSMWWRRLRRRHHIEPTLGCGYWRHRQRLMGRE